MLARQLVSRGTTHSITLSALTRSDGGSVRTMAPLALVHINSKMVGTCTELTWLLAIQDASGFRPPEVRVEHQWPHPSVSGRNRPNASSDGRPGLVQPAGSTQNLGRSSTHSNSSRRPRGSRIDANPLLGADRRAPADRRAGAPGFRQRPRPGPPSARRPREITLWKRATDRNETERKEERVELERMERMEALLHDIDRRRASASPRPAGEPRRGDRAVPLGDREPARR
jgi:hypothetical protein